MDKINKPKTVFLDIDGCIFEHQGQTTCITGNPPKLLPGVKEKFDEWDVKGYNIIITTGRRESFREVTEKQLKAAGLFYDQLVMGIGGGARVLINDLKPYTDEPTAIAVTLERNAGLDGVKV